MGRAPCCDKDKVKRGPWSPEEDEKLKSYIQHHGTGGNWIALPNKIGLKRCGKSCRLRWLNYLRPNIKHGGFSEEEDNIICNLFITIGSRWSIIAAQLPGRTDNDIKNYWNTKLKKKLLGTPKKHTSNINNLSSEGDRELRDAAQPLTNSAMERLPLQMQLQNPFSFYNAPAFCPAMSAGEGKVVQTRQPPNGTSVDGICSQTTPLPEGCAVNCTSAVMRKSPVGSSPGSSSSSSSAEFVAKEGEGAREIECVKEMDGLKESLFWWCNDFDAKFSATSHLWDNTASALPSEEIFQDFEMLRYSL